MCFSLSFSTLRTNLICNNISSPAAVALVHLSAFFFFLLLLRCWTLANCCYTYTVEKKSVISNFLIVIVCYFTFYILLLLCCIVFDLWFFMIYLWNLCFFLSSQMQQWNVVFVVVGHSIDILVCTYYKLIVIECLFVASFIGTSD